MAIGYFKTAPITNHLIHVIQIFTALLEELGEESLERDCKKSTFGIEDHPHIYLSGLIPPRIVSSYHPLFSMYPYPRTGLYPDKVIYNPPR
jgi:hypothetical protein